MNQREKRYAADKKAAEIDSYIQEIITNGDNLHFPKRGDIVTIHVISSLENGTILNNTYLDECPMNVMLGSDYFILGLDEVLLSGKISVGQKLNLKIPPELAYGEKGFPPIIPPASSIFFQLELISFQHYRQTIDRQQQSFN